MPTMETYQLSFIRVFKSIFPREISIRIIATHLKLPSAIV